MLGKLVRFIGFWGIMAKLLNSLSDFVSFSFVCDLALEVGGVGCRLLSHQGDCRRTKWNMKQENSVFCLIFKKLKK